MSERGTGRHQILLAVADAAGVLAPSHFAGVGRQVRTSNLMMNTDLRTAQAGEERLRLIGLGVII
jgi:hypothetical protein